MKNKILFVVCLLFGLIFINSGLNKLFNYIPVPDDLPEDLIKVNVAFMQIGWLMPLIAVVEIIGGLLFIFKKYRALGAIIVFPVLIGILLLHITQVPAGLPMIIILLGIEIWVLIENREKYLPMIR